MSSWRRAKPRRLAAPPHQNLSFHAGWTSQDRKNVQTTPAGLPTPEKLSFSVRERSQQPKNFFSAAGWPAAVDLRFFRLAGRAAGAPKTFFKPPVGQPAPPKLFFSAWPVSRCAFELFLSQRLASRRSKNFFSALGWTPRTKKSFFQSREVQPAPKRQFFRPGKSSRLPKDIFDVSCRLPHRAVRCAHHATRALAPSASLDPVTTSVRCG